MDLGLQGKVALVSGGSSGIGEAIALGLAEEGAQVVIFSRNEGQLKRSVEEIEKATGQKVFYYQADVTKKDDVDRIVSETKAKFGAVHLLVNAAGSGLAGSFDEISEEEWRDNVELNFLGVVRCCRAVLPIMIAQGGGSIVNIAAISAKQPRSGQIVSNATKAAVVNFSKTLALTYARNHIRVNCVNPGLILTPRRRRHIIEIARGKKVTEEEIIREQASVIPMQRLGEAREVAAAALFLLSERASFITGVALDVDGGENRSL